MFVYCGLLAGFFWACLGKSPSLIFDLFAVLEDAVSVSSLGRALLVSTHIEVI